MDQTRTGHVTPSASFLAKFKDSSSVKTFGTGLQTPSRVRKLYSYYLTNNVFSSYDTCYYFFQFLS
jgi:hypothetical protein